MSSKDYFDNVADQWDTMRDTFFSETVRKAALSRAGVRAGQVAADIGAGSGFITEALLQAQLKVIAVDQSEEMLAVMRRKFGDVAIDYHVGRSEALPIRDNHVDHAFANMYLHHVEDPALAICEIARILKPNGKLVITDLNPHNHTFLVEEHHDRWMGFEQNAVAQWFKEAGLSTIAVTDLDSECCATSDCGTAEATITIFVASGVKS
ncbi:MAG: class I SAM-dependent methyltransferase [Cyanobacteria bacterium J06626_14]